MQDLLVQLIAFSQDSWWGACKHLSPIIIPRFILGYSLGQVSREQGHLVSDLENGKYCLGKL